MTTATDLATLKYDLEQSGRWYTEEGQQTYERAQWRAVDDVLATMDPAYAAMLAETRGEAPALTIQIERTDDDDDEATFGTDYRIDLGNDEHALVFIPDKRTSC